MRVAVICASGNAGKSTLAQQMLVPLLNGIAIDIETINSSEGAADMEFSGKDFKKSAAAMYLLEDDQNCVLDIGASNFEITMKHLADLDATRNAIDFWVIPVGPDPKFTKDALRTVKALINIGVETTKMILIPNNVIDIDSAGSDFAQIIAAKSLGVHVPNQVVLSNEVYHALIERKKVTVFSLMANPEDFRAAMKKARAEGNDAEMDRIARAMVEQEMAGVATRNLRAVFAETPMAAALAAQTAQATVA